MKKIIPFIFLLFAASASYAQGSKADTLAPYLKTNTIPYFKILLADSSWFTADNLPKNKPVLIIYFSPDCHHCQMTANEFAPRMDELKDVFLLWVSYHTPPEIKTFAHDYKLDGYDNIKMGRDVYYFFPPFYQIKFTPFMVAYKDGKMLRAFDGGTDPDTIIKLFKE